MKKPFDYREDLRDLRTAHGLIQRIDCSKEENKAYRQHLKNGESLPENVHRYTDVNDAPMNEFYTEKMIDLDEAEKQEYILLLQLSKIETIKKCVIFFTIPAVIITVIGILLLITQ